MPPPQLPPELPDVPTLGPPPTIPPQATKTPLPLVDTPTPEIVADGVIVMRYPSGDFDEEDVCDAEEITDPADVYFWWRDINNGEAEWYYIYVRDWRNRTVAKAWFKALDVCSGGECLRRVSQGFQKGKDRSMGFAGSGGPRDREGKGMNKQVFVNEEGNRIKRRKKNSSRAVRVQRSKCRERQQLRVFISHAISESEVLS